MALSNKFSWLVLTTGNKSELAVGYSTLYGDTAGAYAVIKDVWKTQGVRPCPMEKLQQAERIIPTSIIEKPHFPLSSGLINSMRTPSPI